VHPGNALENLLFRHVKSISRTTATTATHSFAERLGRWKVAPWTTSPGEVAWHVSIDRRTAIRCESPARNTARCGFTGVQTALSRLTGRGSFGSFKELGACRVWFEHEAAGRSGQFGSGLPSSDYSTVCPDDRTLAARPHGFKFEFFVIAAQVY
jgi:hypothetical protein